MKNEVLRVEITPATYKCLCNLAGSIYGETADDIALYLILRGLGDMVRDGVIEARHVRTGGLDGIPGRRAEEARKAEAVPARHRAPATTYDVRLRDPASPPVAPAPAIRRLADDSPEIIWCDQCDRRVSSIEAVACSSRFCKAKAAA